MAKPGLSVIGMIGTEPLCVQAVIRPPAAAYALVGQHCLVAEGQRQIIQNILGTAVPEMLRLQLQQTLPQPKLILIVPSAALHHGQGIVLPHLDGLSYQSPLYFTDLPLCLLIDRLIVGKLLLVHP